MHNPHPYSSEPHKLSDCSVRATPPSSSTRKFLDNIFYIKMDTLQRLEQIENIPQNRHYLRNISNSLDHPEDHEFHARFRFSNHTVRSIFDMISDDLSTFSGKASNIPPMLQLLASLRYFATRSFQIIAGDLLHISQSSVSRIVGKVATAIAAHHQEFIHFPTPNETPLAKYKFSQIGGLPGN